MVRKTVEASLVLSLSLVITLLVVMTIVPRHPVFGQRPAVEGPMIRPAVFVEGIHHRPGDVDTSPGCPSITPRMAGAGCPYLAAIEASSRCPVLSGRLNGSKCPYLSRPPDRPPVSADPDLPKRARFERHTASVPSPI